IRSFAGEPYYVVVQLERLGFSSGVQPAQSSRTKKLLGQHDRQAQDLVQHRGQKRGLETGCRSEVAKGLWSTSEEAIHKASDAGSISGQLSPESAM
ncbi:hypothetical protein PHISCL_11050, partial [Aspergillus sclerotialis]